MPWNSPAPAAYPPIMRSPLPAIFSPSPSSAHAPAAANAAPPARRPILPRDPRWYQIASLAGLLAWGVLGLAFDLGPAQIAVTLGAALLTQWAGDRFVRHAAFEPKSLSA